MTKQPERVVPVEIVTTRKDPFARIIAGLSGLATSSWLVMLALGQIHATYQDVPHPSYGLTVVALYGLRCAVGYTTGQYETRSVETK